MPHIKVFSYRDNLYLGCILRHDVMPLLIGSWPVSSVCIARELPATYRGGGFKLHCNTTTKSCLQWGLSSCVEHNGRIH